MAARPRHYRKAIEAELIKYWTRYDVADPANSTIAKAVGCSVRTVQRVLADMADQDQLISSPSPRGRKTMRREPDGDLKTAVDAARARRAFYKASVAQRAADHAEIAIHRHLVSVEAAAICRTEDRMRKLFRNRADRRKSATRDTKSPELFREDKKERPSAIHASPGSYSARLLAENARSWT